MNLKQIRLNVLIHISAAVNTDMFQPVGGKPNIWPLLSAQLTMQRSHVRDKNKKGISGARIKRSAKRSDGAVVGTEMVGCGGF